MIECNRVDAIKRMNKPARLALVVSKSGDRGANVITLQWFMHTSFEPLMFAISVEHTRYSYKLLSENRKFVLAIPSTKMAEQTLACGITSGRDIDKIREFDIKLGRGKFSDIPILFDAVANFECKTVSQIRSGDHTIFIGEVKYSWQNEDTKLKPLLSVPYDRNYEVLARDGRYILGMVKRNKLKG
jgi:flavin reductase (DIM6/NTAB) family NADH-FMN oxidoreductase RutF